MKQLIVMDQLWHLVRYYSAMTRPDWPVTCANDIDCDDGLWCNGKLCYLGHIYYLQDFGVLNSCH